MKLVELYDTSLSEVSYLLYYTRPNELIVVYKEKGPLSYRQAATTTMKERQIFKNIGEIL